MTCEIAIMNLNAVTLAADSSTTVRNWVNGKEELRFFKGANKILQLTDKEPVGLMLFGSASLDDIPWELIVKDFRRHIGATSFPELSGYASALFTFVEGHSKLFPEVYREKIALYGAMRAVFAYVNAGQQSSVTIKNATTDEEKLAAFSAYFTEVLERVRNSPLPPYLIDREDIRDKLMNLIPQVSANISQLALPGIDAALLSTLTVEALLKHPGSFKASTGVVIAGYGSEEYFPGFIEYECHGLLFEKLLCEKKDERTIAVDRVSYVKPFATRNMVNTFLLGFSDDVLAKTDEHAEKQLRSLAETIRTSTGIADIPDLETHIVGRMSDFRAGWTSAVSNDHFYPFSSVIGFLPVGEMAELAETLIMLESLKEKVTRPTESVGGPIDVAVISKGDGFIWIKRKQYFDSKLNPRFFARLSGRPYE